MVKTLFWSSPSASLAFLAFKIREHILDTQEINILSTVLFLENYYYIRKRKENYDQISLVLEESLSYPYALPFPLLIFVKEKKDIKP